MNEEKAKILAQALGGQPWQSGGGIYVVLIQRQDGHMVSITDECICEYGSREKFEENKSCNTILLQGAQK